MFFIKSHKQQKSHFSITKYVQFSTCNTRFGASENMIHHMQMLLQHCSEL